MRELLLQGLSELGLDTSRVETLERFSSLLLPPVVPYPAEWKLARAYLKAGKYRECADMCEQALKRFPNHAGVLDTLKQARAAGK